jgi:AraC family transcriptional regulator of adaptative response / DNA-3-methyladenine glycosylase II
VALAALGDPDAFPSTDLGVRRAAARLGLDGPDLATRAERWRPWRAYATQYLWATSSHPLTVWPSSPSRGTRQARLPRPPDRKDHVDA